MLSHQSHELMRSRRYVDEIPVSDGGLMQVEKVLLNLSVIGMWRQQDSESNGPELPCLGG